MDMDEEAELARQRAAFVALVAARAEQPAQSQPADDVMDMPPAALADEPGAGPASSGSSAGGEEVRRGPAAMPDHGFAEIAHQNSRKTALAEYRRTIEEFRQTGAVQEKEWGDFSNLTNPPSLQMDVYDAHCQAFAAVEEWQEEEAERQARLKADEDRKVADIRAWEAAKTRGPEDDVWDMRARPDMEAARHPPLTISQPPPAPLPQVRGVEFDARAPSKLSSYQEDGPLLDLQRADDPQLSPDLETEAVLRAMIGECHFLMREVSFRSICQARVLEDRREWVETSMKLAETGATVAKAIGKLRHGPAAREVHHFNTVTKVVTAAQVGGGGSAIP